MRKVKIFFSILFSAAITLMIVCGLAIDGKNSMGINKNEPFLIFIISLIVAGTIPLVHRLLQQIKQPVNWIIIGAICISVLIFQIFIIKDLAIPQNDMSWEDQRRVNATAISLVEGQGIPDEHFEYFSNFPFNLFIVKVSQAVLTIGKTLGLTNFLSYYQILMILNAFFVDISIFLGVLCIKRLFGEKALLSGVLLFVIMSIPIMLYIPVCYTDTFSMPFIMAMLYLLIWGRDNLPLLGKKQHIVYGIVFGLLAFVAASLKITSLILVIAASICLLPKLRKKALLVLLSGILVFVPFWILLANYENTALDTSRRIPITHWLAMGMVGNGNWNQQDYYLTFSAIEKGEDVVRQNFNTIAERFSMLGVGGYFEVLGRKISFTWGDGTFYAPYKLFLGNTMQQSSGLSETFLAGGKSSKQAYKILNIIWLTALLLICFYSFKALFKEESVLFIIIKLSIVGLFIFLLIWETRSRYVLNYLPILIILTFYSIQGLTKPRQKKPQDRDLKDLPL